jgi:capsular polysaccharide biosynthesis protein
MNIDANVQKILFAVLRRWKLIVIFAIIGALIGYFYTSQYTTLTYSSDVKFLAYATDGNDDINENSTVNEIRSSNTSKMNYTRSMLPTYITIMQTNEFNSRVVNDLNETYNSNYPANILNGATEVEILNDTAIFKITVTTTDPDLSYKIARQLETTVPKIMKEKNQGLVRASVEDRAVKATTAGNPGYAKKMLFCALIGIALSAAYVILRTLLDIRIKSSDELTEKYNIPVLGSIPNFEGRGVQTAKGVEDYVKKD